MEQQIAIAHRRERANLRNTPAHDQKKPRMKRGFLIDSSE
jgi:hypothetical protein